MNDGTRSIEQEMEMHAHTTLDSFTCVFTESSIKLISLTYLIDGINYLLLLQGKPILGT